MATKVVKKKATKKVVEKEAAPEERPAGDPRLVGVDQEHGAMIAKLMFQRRLFVMRQDKDGTITISGTPTEFMVEHVLGPKA